MLVIMLITTLARKPHAEALTMWTWLASLLGGPVINGVIAAYKAKLDAAVTKDGRAADLVAKAIDAEIDGRREAAKVRAAEGAWGPTGIIMFGFVVWDVMLG